MPTSVLLHFEVESARRGDLLRFFEKAREYYERPGGIRVRLLEHSERPGTFLELVEYENHRSYALDLERMASDPVMIGLLDEWRKLHRAPVVVETYLTASPQPGP
jgi:hypothetical protein